MVFRLDDEGQGVVINRDYIAREEAHLRSVEGSRRQPLQTRTIKFDEGSSSITETDSRW